MTDRQLADLVLALHAAVVLFVVGGLLAVVVGNLRGWRWVNAPVFRRVHLGAIGFVVVESWLGVDCPLTTLEMSLRLSEGAAYSGGFVADWLRRLLYWDAPPWMFTLAYTAYGLAVVAAWWRWPPRRAGRFRTSAPRARPPTESAQGSDR